MFGPKMAIMRRSKSTHQRHSNKQPPTQIYGHINSNNSKEDSSFLVRAGICTLDDGHFRPKHVAIEHFK
jgi:hypothetical protein